MLRALKDRIKDVEATLTEQFLIHLDEGDAKAATLDDGIRLGKVSKVSGRSTAIVSDEPAFLRWVQKNHPTETEPVVRRAFRDRVLSTAKTHGVAVDLTSGELIPGITLRTGDPYISFHSEKGFQEIVAARWQDLAGPDFLLGGGA